MRLRQYQSSDLPACLEIYRENLKQESIPDKYEHEFVSTLEDRSILSLLLEDSGEIVGCGSVCYEENYQQANLSFGLIHPSHQRRGYGSKLLVARISLLSEADGESTVTLCATENSVGFYGRVVGFGEYARETDEYGNNFYWLYLPLNKQLLLQSQEALHETGIEIQPGLQIPIQREQAVTPKSDRAGG